VTHVTLPLIRLWQENFETNNQKEVKNEDKKKWKRDDLFHSFTFGFFAVSSGNSSEAINY
jgi:hypothetical protein